MTRNNRYVAATLAAVLTVGGGWWARAQAPPKTEQAPKPAPETPPPAQKAPPKTEQAPKPAPGTPAPGTPAPPAQKAPAPPAGIQTLPSPAAKDSVKPDEVVLTIGGEKITRERFEQIKKGLPPQYANAPAQMGDKPFANNYSMFRGLAMLGERDKLDQTPEFREQLNFLRTELLARLAITYLQTKAQEISEQEVKAYHAANQAEFQQARVKGIFVALNPPARPATAPAGTPGAPPPAPVKPQTRTEEEARTRAEELRKQILAGGDFAAIAKANSDHQASAEKGGEFGTVRKNQLPPSLEKVVFSLKPKEVSEPTKEGQGYYIFQAEDVRAVTLDEATATIRGTLQQQKFDAALKNVQAQFPVVYNDRYFSETPAAPRPVITGVAPGQPGAAPAPAAPPRPEKKP